MLKRLPWLINRLRCMSPAEVAYRARSALRARWLARWHARPVAAPLPDNAVTGSQWFAGSVRGPDLPSLCRAADEVVQGRFHVLALGMTTLGLPPDWLRDAKTGVKAPLEFGLRMNIGDMGRIGDIKYLWEPSRHLWLVPLAQAHAASGEQRYLNAAVDLLQSWLVQSPHPLGPHWSSSLEAGIRLINWSAAWHLLGGDAPDSRLRIEHPDFVARWLDSIYWHMRFVSRNLSAYSSANNHLMGELVGLYVGLCTWPRWQALNAMRTDIRRRVQHEALLQNSPDGVNREQATSYQQFVLDFLLIAGLCARAEREDFAADYWHRLESMCTFIAALMDSGGHVPQIGDADDGVACGVFMADADNFSSLLATGAVLFKRGDLGIAARAIDAKTVWLLGDAAVAEFGALKQSAQPTPLPVRFDQGGYAVLGCDPSGPQEVRIVFDAGPLGYLGIAAHGHADALSLLLSVAGQPMLVDPGTYSYLANPRWRDHFRSTAAHNTIELDGRSQSTSGGAFMWTRHANANWVQTDVPANLQAVAGEHHGYSLRGRPLLHRRELSFDAAAGLLVVVDVLDGQSQHDVCLRWHVSDKADISLSGHLARLSTSRGRVEIELPSTCAPRLVHAQQDSPMAWVSHGFEQRSRAAVIECRAPKVTLPLRWVTRMRCTVIASA